MRNKKEGSYCYDFKNSGHVAELMEKWGGESIIKNKYPAVWKAIGDTRDYQMDMRGSNGSDNAHSVWGFVKAGLPDLLDTESDTREAKNGERKTMSALLRMRLEDGSYEGNDSSGAERNESRCWPYAALTGTIENTTDGVQIANFGEEYYQTNGEDQYMNSDLTYSRKDFSNKCVKSDCQLYGIDFNGTIQSGRDIAPSALFAESNGVPIISHISVTAPYSTHHNNPIKMLYDRTPWGDEKGSIDYSYSHVSKRNNQVKTCVPIQATVQFSNYNEPAQTDRHQKPIDILCSDRNYRPSLSFGSPPKTTIIYNREFDDIKKAFIKNVRELNIDFSKISPDHYWNTDMSKTNYCSGGYEIGRTVELDYSLHVRVKNTAVNIVNSVPIHIQSVTSDILKGAIYYEATNTGTVYIPPINIRWGCFAVGTRILMADGSCKPVEKIGQGDVLYTEKGPLAVEHTYLGREKTLLCVCTEGGKTLRVTHTHPIILESRRAVPAKALIPGQRVLLKNGGSDMVKWIFEMEYDGYVYNFEFADGKEHMVEAEGILTGEMIGQNSYRPKNVCRQTVTPQIQEIVEQMSAMLKAAGVVKTSK